MIEALPFDRYGYVIFFSDEILATADDGEIGYFVDVDMEHTDILTNKTRYFPLCPESKKFEKEFSLNL